MAGGDGTRFEAPSVPIGPARRGAGPRARYRHGTVPRVSRPWLLLPVVLALGGCGTSDTQSDSRCWPAASLPPSIQAGPHVVATATDAVTIAWKTYASTAGSVLLSEPGSVPREIASSDVATEHTVVAHGLQPATRYTYDLVVDGVVLSGPHAVRTAPDTADAPVRFSVIGDSGTGCPDAQAVIDAVHAWDPDFVLHVGDAAYGKGEPDEVYARFLVPMRDLMASRPLYLALGNHDVGTLRGQPILDVVWLPTNDEDGSERYYEVRRGPVHAIALDSTLVTGRTPAMLDWLERTLGPSTATWRVLWFHHPPYDSGRHGDDDELIRTWVPIFEQLGVDLVFLGHDHVLERTYPIADGQAVDTADDPDYVDPGGPVYVITGGAGNLYETGTSPLVAYSESVVHHVAVVVDGPTLTAEARTPDGTLVDRLTIRK
jgi:hypothetical protein